VERPVGDDGVLPPPELLGQEEGEGELAAPVVADVVEEPRVEEHQLPAGEVPAAPLQRVDEALLD